MTWSGNVNDPHTMQDEYEFARVNGWAAWTTDDEGNLIEDGGAS